MFTFSPDMASLLLVSSSPSAEKTLSACVDVAGTHRYFLKIIYIIAKLDFVWIQLKETVP